LLNPLQYFANDIGGRRYTICMLTNELKQVRKRLIRSEKLEAIGTLASGIAHDFNNTLSITLGNINLAQMMASPDQ